MPDPRTVTYPSEAARLYHGVWRSYEANRIDEAVNYAQSLVEWQRKTIGTDHPDYAIALHILGLLLERQGRTWRARDLFEQLDQVRKAIFSRPWFLGPREPIDPLVNMLVLDARALGLMPAHPAPPEPEMAPERVETVLEPVPPVAASTPPRPAPIVIEVTATVLSPEPERESSSEPQRNPAPEPEPEPEAVAVAAPLPAEPACPGIELPTDPASLLARFDRLRHRREADFAPLAESRARAAALRETEPSFEALAPFLALLRLVEQTNGLDDRTWAEAHELVRDRFSPPLAAAASRGLLILSAD